MPPVPAQIIPGVVIFDGPIGAGKTTLIGHVKAGLEMKGFRVAVIEELIPDDLDEYYKDPEHTAYEFQKKFINILADRLDHMIHLRSLERYDFILCDRYYASTRGFIRYQHAKGFLTADQVKDLMSRVEVVHKSSPFLPEFFIFVDEPNLVCMERIKSRGRSGEMVAGDDRLSDTNDYIRIFNRTPCPTMGTDKYVKDLERAAKMCATEQDLVRKSLDVKTLQVYNVQLNTAKCKALPFDQDVDLVEMLSASKSPYSHYEILAKERAIVLAGLDPSALVAPHDPDADHPLQM